MRCKLVGLMADEEAQTECKLTDSTRLPEGVYTAQATDRITLCFVTMTHRLQTSHEHGFCFACVHTVVISVFLGQKCVARQRCCKTYLK